MIQKKVQKETVEHVTQIDGQQVNLVVELTFNHRTGQFSISCPIKTKAVSRDHLIQDAIIKQVGTMIKELFARALELRNAWIQENPGADEDQELPFPDDDEEQASDDDDVKLSFAASEPKRRKLN